jgi:hypothetical protein
MPASISSASFVIGAVLLFVALLGGGFKLFGAEVSGTTTTRKRLSAGVLSVPFLALALVGGGERSTAIRPSGPGGPAGPGPGPAVEGPTTPVTARSFAGGWRNTAAGQGEPAALTIRVLSDTEAAIRMTVFGAGGVEDLGEQTATLRGNRLTSGQYFLDSVRRVEVALELLSDDRVQMTYSRIVVGQFGTTTEDEIFELRRTGSD